MIPEQLHYTETHEWVRLDQDVATVGVTDHAQNELSDVVFVGLPEVGRVVRSREAVAVLESVKAASDIYAPLSGEIIEVNSALTEHPELINQSPYEKGWIFKLRVESQDLNGLLDASGYSARINP